MVRTSFIVLFILLIPMFAIAEEVTVHNDTNESVQLYYGHKCLKRPLKKVRSLSLNSGERYKLKIPGNLLGRDYLKVGRNGYYLRVNRQSHKTYNVSDLLQAPKGYIKVINDTKNACVLHYLCAEIDMISDIGFNKYTIKTASSMKLEQGECKFIKKKKYTLLGHFLRIDQSYCGYHRISSNHLAISRCLFEKEVMVSRLLEVPKGCIQIKNSSSELATVKNAYFWKGFPATHVIRVRPGEVKIMRLYSLFYYEDGHILEDYRNNYISLDRMNSKINPGEVLEITNEGVLKRDVKHG